MRPYENTQSSEYHAMICNIIWNTYLLTRMCFETPERLKNIQTCKIQRFLGKEPPQISKFCPEQILLLNTKNKMG